MACQYSPSTPPVTRLLALLFVVVVAAVLAAAARPACAQPGGRRPPDAEGLVRTWLEDRRARAEALGGLSFEEDATLTVDGPFGSSTTEVEARYVADRDADPVWRREVVSVTRNGRPVPPLMRERLGDRARVLLGPALRPEVPTGVLDLVLPRMRPLGRLSPETVDGAERPVAAWRVDLVPRGNAPRGAGPLERMTLWFARDDAADASGDAEGNAEGNGPRLVRTRLLVRPRPSADPYRIVTTYQRAGGFDVPAARHLEGSTRTRRRRQTYTLLVRYDATYDAFRFQR